MGILIPPNPPVLWNSRAGKSLYSLATELKQKTKIYGLAQSSQVLEITNHAPDARNPQDRLECVSQSTAIIH